MGLIRGASAENAIILGPRGPENGPLRFADEYVRHKVLDLIGDLALAGRRIEGHVVAERAGHAMHTALVSRLIKDRSAWELAHVPVETAKAERHANRKHLSCIWPPQSHARAGCRISGKQDPHRRFRRKTLALFRQNSRRRIPRKYTDQIRVLICHQHPPL